MTEALKIRFLILILFPIALMIPNTSNAQEGNWHTSKKIEDRALFTEHFSPQEFADRRNKVYDEIGPSGIAIIQGAAMPKGYTAFRQNNEFFYLSGIESPDAYLILNGKTREATVYLQNRRERREYGEGKLLSFEDADLVKELSGIDHVGSYEMLMADLHTYDEEDEIEIAFTPQSPYEGYRMTRSMAVRYQQDVSENPLDTRPARYQNFITELKSDTPDLAIRNLDPILDELRRIKSEAEIDLIKRSTDLQAAAIAEAIRSTEVGVKAYELEATAKYIYQKYNMQDEAYYALIHVGPDAYMNHYHNSIRSAKSGDMLLMDYGGHYYYYSSDLARMWPTNGKFNSVQKELYTFYLQIYESILYNIEAGLTPQQVMQKAVQEMDVILEETTFSDSLYEQAARDFVDGYRRQSENPEMRLGHGVGMSVHDVGDYAKPIEAGMVFVIEPQFRVSEERIYIRLEDMIIVTEDGVEIYSDYLPRDIESIENMMQEEGLLQGDYGNMDDLINK